MDSGVSGPSSWSRTASNPADISESSWPSLRGTPKASPVNIELSRDSNSASLARFGARVGYRLKRTLDKKVARQGVGTQTGRRSRRSDPAWRLPRRRH